MNNLLILIAAIVIILSSTFSVFSFSGSKENTESAEIMQEVTTNTIDNLENHLLESGLSGERTEMAAEMVGAICGFKYSDPKTEIYEYDVESEQYKNLIESGSIELQGFGITINATAINGKFVMFGESSPEIIEAFNNFK